MKTYDTIELDDFYGDGLKRRRKEAGMTREELANEAQVSTWSIYGYENGHHKPNLEVAVRMYNIINAKLDAKMFPYGRFK